MYFPYLRGKQFELIALRELSDIVANAGNKISPIIEPVKNSPTLNSTLSELATKNINFNIIINPSVGDLTNSTNQILDIINSQLSEYSNFQPAIIIDQNNNPLEYIPVIQEYDVNFNGITLIHNAIKPDISQSITGINSTFPVINNVIHFSKTSRRYYREFNSDTRISLEDFFNTLSKNADYLPIEDSQFSEEHLFFADDGFKGFSDFLTIGDNYLETGFLPYAVVIHLSYSDDERRIRIRHFVSDSNYDTTDVAGKFAEALNKLIQWCNNNTILETMALVNLRDLHQSGHFPGLGSIKKLSIMHHIELVLSLL